MQTSNQPKPETAIWFSNIHEDTSNTNSNNKVVLINYVSCGFYSPGNKFCDMSVLCMQMSAVCDHALNEHVLVRWAYIVCFMGACVLYVYVSVCCAVYNCCTICACVHGRWVHVPKYEKGRRR